MLLQGKHKFHFFQCIESIFLYLRVQFSNDSIYIINIQYVFTLTLNLLIETI